MFEPLTVEKLMAAIDDIRTLSWARTIRDAETIEVKTSPYIARGKAFVLQPEPFFPQAKQATYVCCNVVDKEKVSQIVVQIREAGK